MIKLKNYFVGLFILIAHTTLAQSGLMIQGTSPDLHLSHTIATKDTWFGIGRLYNISPKEVASYNGTTIDKPLTVGKQIKIPLTSSNFSQNGAKGADEVFVPLYHTVQPKEWMYRISVNHNKVPIETLEKWNNITRDNAVAGTKLIVGYLKVKQGQSALANGAVKNVAAISTPAVTKEPATPKKEEFVKKPEEEKQPSAKKEAVAKNQEVVKKPEQSEIHEVAKKDNNVEAAGNVDFKGGYFKTQYDAMGKSTSGVSGIFKSTSGWNDGKYYALMNNVPVGTIVRVNFPSTNKNIYAKVLGQLPDMKESNGLTIRISDAAATELGAGAGKFTVDVKY
jgi:LysM repeat protein